MTHNGNLGYSTFKRIQRITLLGTNLNKIEQDLNSDKLQAFQRDETSVERQPCAQAVRTKQPCKEPHFTLNCL